MSSKKRILNPVETKVDKDYIELGSEYDFLFEDEGDDIYDRVYGEGSRTGRDMGSKS